MKTTHTVLLGFAAAMMLTQGAQAQTPRGGVQPPPAPVRTVFYVGGSLGHTTSKEDTCSSAAFSCDRRDTNFGVQAGLDFNRFVAVEVGYRNLGKIQEQNSGAGQTAEVTTRLIEGVGILALPVDRISVYVKGGLYRAKTQLKSNFLTEADTTNTQGTLGAGIRWDVFDHFGVRLEYQRYNNLGSAAIGFRGDVDTYSLGAVFRF
jgi:OmpA-OmpF porin, OOP family